MARQAIRLEGDEGERLFVQLVPSARLRQKEKGEKEKDGDAVVNVDGREQFIEVKECHALPGKPGTINQIRPIK